MASQSPPHPVRLFRGQERSAAPAAALGGKAANLVQLEARGVQVPRWFCIGTSVFEALLARTREPVDAALAGLAGKRPEEIRSLSDRIAGLLREAGLADADGQSILAAFDAEFSPDARVAVRSSVVGEDSAQDSFAGQMDTFLFVTRSQLLERVLDTFASAYSERALLYRARRGQTVAPVRAAVVVQEMIDSTVSGVLFTANPSTGDLDEVVVVAGYGLGEGIVSGLVETDTFFLDPTTRGVRKQLLSEKQSRIVFDAARGAGTRTDVVAPDRVSLPALSIGQLEQLVEHARRATAGLDRPQDIEWAIDAHGGCYLLQIRPVTTLGSGRESVFDNSNVGENYPGLTLPLTFSAVRDAYREVFSATARMLGVPEERISADAAVYANLVGLLDGRMYYNLLHWYRLYASVPGTAPLLPAFEKALALPPRPVAAPVAGGGRGSAWLLQAGVIARAVNLFFTCARRSREFLTLTQAALSRAGTKDLDSLDAHQLLDDVEQLYAQTAPPYGISVVNDLFTQQLYELLRRMIERFQLGNPEVLRNELLCADRQMESVAPVESAERLTDLILSTPALAALFGGPSSDREIFDQVAADPAVAAFHREVLEHIRRYGDRTLEELKLEATSLEEAPALLIGTLRNFLRARGRPRQARRDVETRQRAEAQVRKGLKGHPLRALLFWFVVKRVRFGVANRENLRFARTRIQGLARRYFRQLGRRLHDCGLLSSPRDIFYLELHEVSGAIRGHAVTRSLRELVALRRREYEDLATSSPPQARVLVRGVVAARGRDRQLPTRTDSGKGGVLQGVACSPGRVRAPAKVLLNPRTDQQVDGEILIAPTTDPAWVYLMVAAGGLVSERGSLLSHTAIVGRELGVPTVVGVKDATRVLRTGQRLELDGDVGTVRVLDDAPEEPEPAHDHD